MSACRDLDRYLDRSLDPTAREAFERHLRECDTCRAEVRDWRDIELNIMLCAETRSDFQPDPMQARRLIARARTRTVEQGQVRRRWIWGLGLTAAAAVATAIVVVVPRLGEPPAPAPSERLALRVIDDGGTSISPGDTVAGATWTAAASKRLLVELGRDRVGLSRSSRVEVVAAARERVRLRLHAGSVALDVVPRGRGEQVEVEAGPYLVAVIGTRFRVSKRPSAGVEVEVAEGRVRVLGAPGGIQEVAEAERLRLDHGRVRRTPMPAAARRSLERLLRNPEPVEAVATWDGAGVESFEVGPSERERAGKRRQAPKPRPVRVDELAEWRQWVLDGKYEAAERALGARVRRAPKDGAAWSLLADCRRKAGRFGPAVKAYRQASKVAEPSVANRARFMAASVLQDELGDHAAAVVLLRAYLAEGQALRPLEAAAEVRLARSLASLGRAEAARELLERVIERHPRSPAAAEAERMLRR